MTNLDKLKEASNGAEFRRMYKFFNLGCRQVNKEVWQNHCLKPEYRGHGGCEKCIAEFWDMEYIEGV